MLAADDAGGVGSGAQIVVSPRHLTAKKFELVGWKPKLPDFKLTRLPQRIDEGADDLCVSARLAHDGKLCSDQWIGPVAD